MLQLWEDGLRELEEGIQEGQKSIKPGPKEPLVVKEKFIQMKVSNTAAPLPVLVSSVKSVLAKVPNFRKLPSS
jgi:hypothetical protein